MFNGDKTILDRFGSWRCDHATEHGIFTGLPMNKQVPGIISQLLGLMRGLDFLIVCIYIYLSVVLLLSFVS